MGGGGICPLQYFSRGDIISNVPPPNILRYEEKIYVVLPHFVIISRLMNISYHFDVKEKEFFAENRLFDQK